MSELWTKSASELVAAIAAGEITSLEATTAHIERIEAVDGMLGAVVVRRFEEALAEARRADELRASGAPLGPMHGLPVTIKEIFDVTGTPSTFGLMTRAHDLASTDDPYVARWRAAGAIVMAKTNVSQLTIFVESDNPVYGRTNNPWDIARSPGGSSGGEGAVIAAGGSPLGLGSDIGGSLRAPAAFNGIASLKPTAGRLDDLTRFKGFAGQRAIVSQAGPMARRVADLELGLHTAHGPDREDQPPLRRAERAGIRGLRIGVYETLAGFAPSPALARATREASDVLRDLGATVVPFWPPAIPHAMDLFYGILSADGMRGNLEELGKGPRDSRVAELVQITTLPRLAILAVEALLRRTGETSFANIVRNYGFSDAHHYWRLVAALQRYRERFAAAMENADGGPLDLLVCPPAGLPALKHGESARVITAGPYGPLYNVLGYPCGTLPFSRVRPGEETVRTRSRDRMENGALHTERDSAGLPVDVQLVGRPWREDLVFTAMYALEEVATARPDFPGTPVTPTYGPASQK